MKGIKTIAYVLLTTTTFSSCATVFGGKITECQRTKPAKGQPARQVRVVPLVANIILFPIGIGIDFLTHAAYKPCPGKK